MRNSIEYPKTENLFNRDPETHKLIVGDLRNPAFGQINLWHVSEKIDGTNMRVLYDPELGVEIRGRSDKANIHGDLLAYMQGMFTEDKMSAQFDEFLTRDDRRGSVTIFGEGYGPGIQKGGGNYAPAKLFRMFDVMYHWTQTNGDLVNVLNSWAMQETVDMIAYGLGPDLRAPVLHPLSDLPSVVNNVLGGLTSAVASMDAFRDDVLAEGVIARTEPYLYTAYGQRVMFKLKAEDLA